MPANTTEIEKKLWATADSLRANSRLKASEYSVPVLGMIPEGWEAGRASAAVYIDPPTRLTKEGEKPFVPMGSLSNGSMLIDNIEYRAGNSGSKFKNGDTLFARITPCIENGKTGYVQFLPKFSEQISPIFRSIHVLAKKNTNLRRTRDLLLPGLISGEVDVEGLDIETGEGMTEAAASIEEDVKKSAEVTLVGEQRTLCG
jgi:hypothetical protein